MIKAALVIAIKAMKASENANIPEFKAFDETGIMQLNRHLNSTDSGLPIIGHDAFYHAKNGIITRIPFDTGEASQFMAECSESSQCLINFIAYGDGIYFGIDLNGTAYKSQNAQIWELVDLHMDTTEFKSVSYAHGCFLFSTSIGIIGASFRSQNYGSIDYYPLFYNVEDISPFNVAFTHSGIQFFVTDTGIAVSESLYSGTISRLAFLEESPDDEYEALTVAFWNDHIVMFDGIKQKIYVMPMRYPSDKGGNFIDPEWIFNFQKSNGWNYDPACGVGAYGDYLLVCCRQAIYCIDRNGNVSQMTTEDLQINNIKYVLAAEKTILLSIDETRAYQFFIK